jgi:hypothetical protein
MDDDSQRYSETTPDRVRQGVTGHGVRYVLATGLLLAIVAGILVYLLV